MPQMDGLTLLQQLQSHSTYQRIPVIVLTGDSNDHLLANCFLFGAKDFINKPINELVLQSRIQSALGAQEYIRRIESQKKTLEARTQELMQAYDQLQQEVLQRQRSEAQLAEAREMLLNLLTPREQEILALIVQGDSSKEIAYQLHLSISTVENHRYNLMQKLNVHDVGTLISLALKNKLVSLN